MPRADSTTDAAEFDRQRRVLLALLPLSETARAAYLDKACAGDPKLRRDVESLLRADPDRALPSVVQTGGVFESKARLAGRKPARPAPSMDPLPKRIGPFQVLGLLGRGGMGIVLRGRDSRLGREVALKILPEALAGEPRLLARFRREAQLVAALNHPHIAQIYGLEESDGANALVMELVGGTTLAERLDAGPLELFEALDIARQIAEAIETAHDRGIVHRDLKPANIMITVRGAVKILDFGVATALGPTSAEPGCLEAPERSSDSAAGLSVRGLGTPAYMSPEQLRKKPVTRAADVWAFGCVCFEMLSGHAAFAKQKMADTLAAVLTGSPDWSLLPVTTPPAIKRLLSRCLRRDENERLRDIRDVRILLDDIALDRAALMNLVPAKPPRRARAAVVVVGALAALIAGSSMMKWIRVTPSATVSKQLVSEVAPDVVAAPLRPAYRAPSPEGLAASPSPSGEASRASTESETTTRLASGSTASVSAVTTPPPPLPAEAVAEANAVARYLDEIERLQARGKYWTDAQVLGRAIMDQAMSGDASGFDKLIESNQAVRESISRMEVPAPCAEHHSLTVSLLDESLSLLRAAGERALAEDGSALETLASQGMGIEAKARAVDSQAEDLRRRFGVAR